VGTLLPIPAYFTQPGSENQLELSELAQLYFMTG